MKPHLIVIYLCFICFVIGIFVYPASANNFKTLFEENEYYTALHKLFSEAEESIDIVISAIVANPKDPQDPVNKLLGTLFEARERGVRVRVVFEDTTSSESFLAYRSLLESGVDVYFDASRVLVNSKMVVVDSHICVIGSPDWSADSWRGKVVSAVLDSSDMAKVVSDSISKFPLAKQPSFIKEEAEGVLIPHDFLLLKKFGIRLMNERAENPFGLYLVLIKEAQEKGQNSFLLDYEKCGKRLYLEKDFFRSFKDSQEEKEYYYQRVKKILRVLRDRYNLIEYDESSDEVALLKQFDIDLAKPDATHPCFILPHKFWDDDFPHRLSLSAKYMYLVCLLEAKKSARSPYWFSNEYMLSELYSLNLHTVSSGLERLEEENLIEVARAPHLEGESFKDAKKVYCINQIVTDEEFKKRIEELSTKYGDDITKQAREQASELDESKDLLIIETFIHLIKKYGYLAVRRANVDTLNYKKGSSLRHISTTIKFLEKD